MHNQDLILNSLKSEEKDEEKEEEKEEDQTTNEVIKRIHESASSTLSFCHHTAETHRSLWFLWNINYESSSTFWR